jgi:RNA polymerase sigma-70 factor (ECF subfamily)
MGPARPASLPSRGFESERPLAVVPPVVDVASARPGKPLPCGGGRDRSPPEASPSEADRDRALLAGVAARDPAALETLYVRHASALLGLCLRVTRDRSAAEEVLGDVFFELWERAERFDASRSTPLAYLTTLARSRAIDRLRRERRRASLLDASRSPEEAREPAAHCEDPLTAVQVGERSRLVEELLGALDREERRALELSFFAGLSHTEIAVRLKQPVGTVKTRVRRALLRLRDGLEARAAGLGLLP